MQQTQQAFKITYNLPSVAEIITRYALCGTQFEALERLKNRVGPLKGIVVTIVPIDALPEAGELV